MSEVCACPPFYLEFCLIFAGYLKCYLPMKTACPNSPAVKCSLSQSIFISLPQHFSKLQMIFGFYLLPHFFFSFEIRFHEVSAGCPGTHGINRPVSGSQSSLCFCFLKVKMKGVQQRATQRLLRANTTCWSTDSPGTERRPNTQLC